MSYTKEDSIFPFNEQEDKNFIIYGVNVPYNSFEEGEEIYEKVMNDLDMIRIGGSFFCFGYIVVGFKILTVSVFKKSPTPFNIPPSDVLREYDETIKKFYPNLKPKMYYFPTVCIG